MLAIGVLFSGLLYGEEGLRERAVKDRGLQKPTIAASLNFDGNRIDCDMENNGMIVSQAISGRSGMSWPVGNNTQTVYASGIWIGGLIGNIPHVTAGEYAGEFVSGPWGSDPFDPQHTIYKVNKSDLADPLANPHFQNWPVEFGAPWVDVNDNGTYDPLPNGPDHPEFIGDQVVWMLLNDGDPTAHSNVFNTNPLGLEMELTIFGFDRPDAFGDMMFVKALITNKGEEDIVDTYIGLWSDPDLGDAADDFVGCVPELGLGICYNDGVDKEFAAYAGGTPAVGYDFFQGPIVPAPGETALVSGKVIQDYKNLSMTSFSKYINAPDPVWSDPNTAAEAYNLMKGLMKSGVPFADNLTGGTPFVHPGDPNLDTGPTDEVYVDSDVHASGDRRFLMNTGPFTMKVGDVQEIVFAIFMAAAGDALDSYTYLKEVDKIAQLAYDTQFALPPSPPQPEVTVTTYVDEIILTWDSSAENYIAEDVIDKDPDTGENTEYIFEGYNVWQYETISGSGAKKRIATYDLNNGITEIFDDVFDANFGEIINRRVQFGSDSGIKRNVSITKDAINNGVPLKTNRVYYFSVNAYGYNPYGIPLTLESPAKIMAIRPQVPNIWEATDNTAVVGQTIEAVHIGPAAGSVQAVVVNPKEITGDDYEVSFKSVDGNLVWDLTNTTTGTKLIDGNPVQGGIDMVTGDDIGVDALPIVEGLQVQVSGPAAGIDPNRIGVAYGEGSSTSATYLQGWDFAGTRWIGGRDKGWIGLFGGLGNGSDHIGTSLSSGADYMDVEMRFAGLSDATGFTTVEEMMAASKLENPDRWSKGVALDGWGDWHTYLVDLPFTVWDVESDPERQLRAAIIEDSGTAAQNSIWDMGWDPATSTFVDAGAYEYIYLISDDYDVTYTEYLGDGSLAWSMFGGWPVLYTISPKARGSHPYLEANFELMVFAAKVNTENDTYTFSTSGLEGNEVGYDPDNIKVWPNPYFGYNPEERDPIEQIVQFTHLPESGKCTIRIFNIAGVPVRTLNHTDGTQFETWDLKNNFRIPVASGMYIAVVETDKGDKLLKLAIIQPEQRLDVY